MARPPHAHNATAVVSIDALASRVGPRFLGEEDEGLRFSGRGRKQPPVVGAWSVNPRHAVVSIGVRWRYMASSDALSACQPGGLAGSPKAGVAGSNPAGGTSEAIFRRAPLESIVYSSFMVRSNSFATCGCTRPRAM